MRAVFGIIEWYEMSLVDGNDWTGRMKCFSEIKNAALAGIPLFGDLDDLILCSTGSCTVRRLRQRKGVLNDPKGASSIHIAEIRYVGKAASTAQMNIAE